MASEILETEKKEMSSHMSFDEMADYVFSDGRSASFMRDVARINHHVMNCPECYKLYQSMMVLYEDAVELSEMGTEEDRTLSRVLAFLARTEADVSIEKLKEESRKFKKWISFRIENLKELAQCEGSLASHPQLVSVMKSSVGKKDVEETAAEIRSSLYDEKKNRVSIGLDGTLTLYFDSKDHPLGKRIIVLSDDEQISPRMLELSRYDNSIAYVRFEGLTPGRYTVVLEE